MSQCLVPTRLDGFSPTEMLIEWSSGEKFKVPYLELRLECPCAICVDENTGRRVLRREELRPDVKPTGAQVVGRYAVQFTWNDGHGTGMFHFDRLRDLCVKHGRTLTEAR